MAITMERLSILYGKYTDIRFFETNPLSMCIQKICCFMGVCAFSLGELKTLSGSEFELCHKASYVRTYVRVRTYVYKYVRACVRT